MRELLELLEHDARRPAGELAAMLHRSEYEVEQPFAAEANRAQHPDYRCIQR